MASITKRPGPKGTTWRVVYREPDGRQRARHFPTKAEAERFRAEVTTDLHRGVYRDPDAGNVSFEAVFNAWLDGRRVDLAPSTWALYESVGITHVAGEFAEQRIGGHSGCRRADVDRRPRQGGTRPQPDRDGAAGHARGLRAGRGRWPDPVEPGRWIEALPRPEHVPDRRVLVPEEVEAIADAIDPRYRVLVLIGGYCGLRLGEALGLRWKRIDILTRTIMVAEQLDRMTLQLAPLKTRASRRVVPMPAFIADELAAIAPAPVDPEALVFTTEAGGPIRDGNFRRRIWAPALEAAGLAPAKFHDLRHHCAGFAISLGAHPKEIAVMLTPARRLA